MATRFIRRNGRIIPITVKNEAHAANEITSGAQNRKSWAKVAGGVAAGLAGLYVAGRMHRKALTMVDHAGEFTKKGGLLNRLAKFTKYGSSTGAALVAGREMAAIDARSNDERGQVFNLGNATQSGLATGATVVGGYGTYRVGKRIEFAGKQGMNLLKLENLKKLRYLKTI